LANEDLKNYSRRLLDQILTESPILIGVSFGGMVAVEIGKLILTDKVILISSAMTKSDLPKYYDASGPAVLRNWIPASWLKNVNPLTYFFFGTKSNEEKQLLKAIIKETDVSFLKWAMVAIATWRNETRLDNATQIHGTADKIIPYKVADFPIKDGGHFMIVSKADVITKLIRNLLK
jgi:pimeloyl-ACP methyl ester carboxylesterase